MNTLTKIQKVLIYVTIFLIGYIAAIGVTINALPDTLPLEDKFISHLETGINLIASIISIIAIIQIYNITVKEINNFK